MQKVMNGNHAVAWGARLSRVEVIAAYPITPQTSIAELLAEFVSSGQLAARYINVESEHSSMATLIGASLAGVRTFTATSSQGLALMHELLHWASGSRLPVVLANANRALAPPWSILCDHQDSLSQRDTGWMQFYCESAQECLDSVILAFKVAEQIQIPAMVMLDGFLHSHTVEPVDIPEQSLVDGFLPGREAPFKLDVDNPSTFGGLSMAEYYYEFRYKGHLATEEAKKVYPIENRKFSETFGRSWPAVEAFQTEDAEVVIVLMGSAVGAGREAVLQERARGKRWGLIKLKMFRPFPDQDLLSLIPEKSLVVVFDRNLSYGMGGIIQQELKSVFYTAGRENKIVSAVAGLGGRDIKIEDIQKTVAEAQSVSCDKTLWVGAKL